MLAHGYFYVTIGEPVCNTLSMSDQDVPLNDQVTYDRIPAT